MRREDGEEMEGDENWLAKESLDDSASASLASAGKTGDVADDEQKLLMRDAEAAEAKTGTTGSQSFGYKRQSQHPPPEMEPQPVAAVQSEPPAEPPQKITMPEAQRGVFVPGEIEPWQTRMYNPKSCGNSIARNCKMDHQDLCQLGIVKAALTESEKFAETAESEDSDPSECSSAISTADLPNGHPQEKSAELTVKTSSADCTDVTDVCQETGACQVLSGLPDASQVQVAGGALGPALRTDVTFKGVLRQLLQQLHGLHNLSRQHPFWLHTTLSESFRLSACSKAHAALFEEAAALAVIRRQQQLRGDILCDDSAFDEPWEEDDLPL
eukprot:symbB.v1.2.012354.t1/scaffold854.1/size229663/8